MKIECFPHLNAHPCCWLARLMRPDQSGHVHVKPAKPAHTYMRTHTYIHNLNQPQEDNEEDDEVCRLWGRQTGTRCVCVCVCMEFERGRGGMY